MRIKDYTALRAPMLSPGLLFSLIVSTHALPKMTRSNNELAPRRLAP